jgi:hypothetical protein
MLPVRACNHACLERPHAARSLAESLRRTIFLSVAVIGLPTSCGRLAHPREGGPHLRVFLVHHVNEFGNSAQRLATHFDEEGGCGDAMVLCAPLIGLDTVEISLPPGRSIRNKRICVYSAITQSASCRHNLKHRSRITLSKSWIRIIASDPHLLHRPTATRRMYVARPCPFHAPGTNCAAPRKTRGSGADRR